MLAIQCCIAEGLHKVRLEDRKVVPAYHLPFSQELKRTTAQATQSGSSWIRLTLAEIDPGVALAVPLFLIQPSMTRKRELR